MRNFASIAISTSPYNPPHPALASLRLYLHVQLQIKQQDNTTEKLTLCHYEVSAAVYVSFDLWLLLSLNHPRQVKNCKDAVFTIGPRYNTSLCLNHIHKRCVSSMRFSTMRSRVVREQNDNTHRVRRNFRRPSLSWLPPPGRQT